MRKFLAILILISSTAAIAEEAVYGSVWLNGLAKYNSWPLNSAGPANAMVCNVNGPDGFLAVRACASTDCKINRSFRRLAVLEVNTAIRSGNWVYVTGAYRNTDEWGNDLAETKILPVNGWAHDNYLCDFIH